MATATKETVCATCGKNNGRVRCEGCSQLFCVNHFNDHRQQLATQLDDIETTRNLFRQTLIETISEPQNHALIQQINEWESQSIAQVRQTAQDAKQRLIKHATELGAELEEKLNKLTDQLRQSRAENDYFEPNLDQWREQLKQMQRELNEPSTATIKRSSKSLVMEITVTISGELDHVRSKH